jgi:Tol biopolymer transport system component
MRQIDPNLLLLAAGIFPSRFSPMSDLPTADLVYAEGDEENTEIYVVDFQTGSRTRLSNNIGVGLPQAKRYSPVGSWIMNVEWLEEEGVSLLLLEGLTGEQTNRVIGKYGVFYGPYNTLNWSPDGQWVTFAAHPYDPKVDTDKEAHAAEIWIVRISTGEIKRLTNNTYPDRYPAFSPDGTQIAYMSSKNNGFPLLSVMDVATGESRVLNPDRYSNNAQWYADTESRLQALYRRADHPSWSPDGQWIAYQTLYFVYLFDKNTADYELYLNLSIIRADGSNAQAVTVGGKNSTVHEWRP